MSALYELAGQYRELQAIDDMEPEAITDTLEALEGEIEKKAEAIVAVRAGMDASITAIDNEIKRLQARKNVIQNREASLRDYLKSNMQATGIKKITCDLFSITLAKGRDILTIDDESKIPEDYMKVSTSIAPDKVKILADIKAGSEVEGCRAIRSDDSVRIK